MRIIVTATAVAIASVMVGGLSLAQTYRPANNYDRCAGLAKWEGLDPKSARGRAFVARCMQRDPRRSCPDDSKARSAYPAWMCP
jgi:hypothetical protein